MKPVPGICDRCGLRYHLKDLKQEYVLGKATGQFVCRYCLDPSHPQLDTRGVRTDDKQSVKNARPDNAELDESRKLYGFKPVGAIATSTITTRTGKVTVT